ncbi:MAG: NAD(P)H-hydrate dehydratase [Geminicoccaceae bacterium]|nr:NAD(P)H-hydrate dehydratase [Geminicoccaceae bacterium]
MLGSRDRLKGDAALAADTWPGEIVPLRRELLTGAGLVVDALFGAGLARPIEGEVAELVESVTDRRLPVVAVDVPSGIHGDSGAVLGVAAPATLTVTFHRPKPGHYLMPGREVRGELVVADIGIPQGADASAGTTLHLNAPSLWPLPVKSPAGHKYSHGHALVTGGGPASSGAGRLGARAALRAGAGAVTMLVSAEALPVHAGQLTAIMVNVIDDDAAFGRQLADDRRNAILLGPGGGVGKALRTKVLMSLKAGKACVLDADALTSFEDRPDELFQAIRSPCLMTPHDGEFRRLFDVAGDKLQRARAAASTSGAVVLIKGADTVVAAPDGRAVIQGEASADLATAGAGDVLAGIALGLLARGMDIFAAASAAVWLHAEAAAGFGPGLIAEDLPDRLPGALRRAIMS